MKFITLLLVTLFSFSSTFSQETPREIAAQFFKIYNTNTTGNALEYLFSKSPYASEIREGIADVKTKLKRSALQAGAFYGEDLLSTRSAGRNVVMLTYLVRHDREPFLFHIMFYKPFDKWHMQNFKYGNSIDDELEEAAKVYRMQENYPQ